MLGPDYARMDGNSAPDWTAAFKMGARFTFIRKGHCYFDDAHRAWRLAFDPTYARDCAAARAAGVVVGSYMLPRYGQGAPSPAEQVANFKAAPGDILRGKDLPPCLDVEFPGGASSTGLTAQELLKLVEATVIELATQFKCRPIVYTSYNQMYDLGLPKSDVLADCDLWLKTAYIHTAHAPVDSPPHMLPHVGESEDDKRSYYQIPPSWDTWMADQYQGDAIGFGGFDHQVDVSRWNVVVVGDSHWTADHTLIAKRIGSGALDAAALRRDLLAFQAAHGLEADAVVGPMTRAAMSWL
jgi:hypothetical protein